MKASPMIELHGITKTYGSFNALKGISLSINQGEIFGFLGVNGAGKTTTLRILAGILRPTTGTAFIGGFSLLYPKLTGREHLYFVADLYRVRPREADRRIDELLSDYALRDWQDELIESYSHGMKQRLATCAALVAQPRVLIVDEPMVGLDPHGAKLLKDSFRRYAAAGMSILLSTHSLNVAEEVSDRVAIIHQGALLDTGTVSEIQARNGLQNAGLEEMFLQLTANVYA